MGQTLSSTCGSGTRQYFHAANLGEIGSLKEVLISRPDLLEATSSGGQNVVHLAAAKGDREVLKAVVEVFTDMADVQSTDSPYDYKVNTMRNLDAARQLRFAFNQQNSTGQTPLMLAAKNGHVACVRFLVDKGADVFKTDRTHSRSVLHYAIAQGRDSVVRYLVNDNTLMHTEEGVQALRSIMIKDFSGQCRYIDSRAENGLTALHIAAVQGDLKCVKLLLDAGASMMVRTVDMDMPSAHSVPNGSTPLHLAAQKGSVAIVQAMLQAHADAMGNWSSGNSPQDGRRGWEQSTRIDLRSVANTLRQLPYHVAWQRGFRQTAQILNPTIAIDIALENVRELDEGFGPQKLSTLAAYCLRRNLLDYLETHKVLLDIEKKEKEQRAAAKKVIAQQKRREALKMHSQGSVDQAIASSDSKMVSNHDQGHTFSLNSDRSTAQNKPRQPKDKRRRRGNTSEDVLSTIHSTREASNHSSEDPSIGENLPTDSLPGDEPSAFSDQTEVSSAFKQSAASRIRRSMKKLKPSRPPPPPPEEFVPSQSGPTSTAQPIDSLEGGTTLIRTESPPQASVNCFSSPFAQESTTVRDESASEEEAEGPSRPRATMTQHPSGVCLVDPPDGGAWDGPNRLQTAKSGRGSFSLAQRMQSSFTAGRSRKNLRMSRDFSRDFSRAASIPGFDNNLDADEDCGICLEEPVNVGIAGCHHKLCVDCAIKLCQVAKKPPLCPFCRITINAFEKCECDQP